MANNEYTGAPDVISTYHAGGAGLDIHASPNAFGASMFDALHGVGQAGLEAVLKRQELVNDLDHNNRALDVSKQFSDTWSEYGQLEGDAAIKGLPAYQKRLRDIYNQAIQSAPNPVVQKQLSQTLFRDADRYMSHGANYADTQLRHWHNKVHEDAIENNINQAVLNRKQPLSALEDIIERGANGVGGANSVRERALHKFGPDTDLNSTEVKATIEGEVAKYRSAAVLPVIKELADEGDVAGAERVFSHFKDKLDGKGVVAAEGFLRPKLKEKWVNDTANELRPIPNPGGYNPTVAAKAFKDGLMAVPSRANAQALGIEATSGVTAPVRYHGAHLPAEAESAIDKASRATGVDAGLLRTFANIESSGRPGARTGRYSGLFQLDHTEFSTHGGGNIFNADDNAMAAARKIKADSASFRLATGRDATPFDLYMVHQQGIGGAPAHMNNPNGVAWQNVRPFYTDVEAHKHGFANGDAYAKAAIWGNVPADQRARFPGGVDSLTSGQFLGMWRNKFARLSGSAAAPEGAAQPQPQPQAQPESPLLTGSPAKQQRRASNLEIAEQRSGGDPEKRNALYAELNKRDVLIQNSIADRHQQIAFGVKMIDSMAQKGLPGLTLENVNLNEQMIRESFPADKQWQAEHIIEGVKFKTEEANKLHSLRFASKADVDAHFVETQSGSGVDSMLESHRKKEGTTGAFAMGADPEARTADIAHRFDLHEQARTLDKQWHERRQKILDENPAQWVMDEPNVSAKAQALKAAEASRDPGKIAEAFNDYANASIAVQRQMGVPEDKIHVLTAEVAQSWTSHIMKSTDPKGEMDMLAKTHGQQWNQIFHDLITVGGLPPKMEAVQYLDDYNARTLSNVIKGDVARESESGGKKEHRTYEDMIPPAPDGHPGKRLIDDTISNNPDMKDFKESLVRRGLLSQVNEIQESVRSLAYGRAVGAGGRPREDHGVAANEAVKAFVANHEFTSDKAMIPKSNASELKQIMAFTKESLTNHGTAMPGWTKTGPSMGLPGDQDYLQRAKSLGSWVNTFNGDGVEYRDHTGRTMHYADGKPVRVMFNNLDEARKRMKTTQYFTDANLIEPTPYVGYDSGR